MAPLHPILGPLRAECLRRATALQAAVVAAAPCASPRDLGHLLHGLHELKGRCRLLKLPEMEALRQESEALVRELPEIDPALGTPVLKRLALLLEGFRSALVRCSVEGPAANDAALPNPGQQVA